MAKAWVGFELDTRETCQFCYKGAEKGEKVFFVIQQSGRGMYSEKSYVSFHRTCMTKAMDKAETNQG